MKTNKEKFVEIDGRIKLVNQKIDLIIKNHLHHMKKDIDRILYSLGAIDYWFYVNYFTYSLNSCITELV